MCGFLITFLLLLILFNQGFGSTLYINSLTGSYLIFVIPFCGSHKAFEGGLVLNCRIQKLDM